MRLKGGDPLVFGRGGEEALALAAAGVPFRIVPGVTAGHGALAYAGIPATHRGRAQSVAFVTGHHAGGGDARDVDWAALARGAQTLVLYMALQRLPAIADALLAAGRDPQDPVAILCDATTPRQRLLRTTLGEAAAVAAGVDRASATLIAIGPVVALSDLLSPWLEAAPAVLPTRRARPAAGNPRLEARDVWYGPADPARDSSLPGRAHRGAERRDGARQRRAAPLALGLSRGLPRRAGEPCGAAARRRPPSRARKSR